tara:strand:- start:3514 stop:3936 length:423 start_codon:yes stop_codon:yes gene_type:complete
MQVALRKLAEIGQINSTSISKLEACDEESSSAMLTRVNEALSLMLFIERKHRQNDMCFVPALSNYYTDDLTMSAVKSACQKVVATTQELSDLNVLLESEFKNLKSAVMTMVAQIERMLVKCNYCRVVDHMAIERFLQKLE